ncbi:MAG TPA: ribonuclease P protein component [Myxococcales bacterium]|nr:ribonuclease P protein component [Myxococcales bacterium]HIN85275.1 ribonuclease P protein component [Myxococcales bacterium]
MICELGADTKRFVFPRESRLKKRRQFLAIQHTGQRRFTQHFIVIISKGETQHVRLGVTASKRVGNAVVRNRWKRIIREVFRRIQSELDSGQEIIVIARNGQEAPTFVQALRELRGALCSPNKGNR